MKARDFALDVLLFERRAIDVLRLAAVQAQHAPKRQPFRDGHAAPETLCPYALRSSAQTRSSPNLHSNNSHTAAIAASSSLPSTVNSNSVPRAAASSNTLKIDFASAVALPSVRESLMLLLKPEAVRTRRAAARACKPRRFVTRMRRSNTSTLPRRSQQFAREIDGLAPLLAHALRDSHQRLVVRLTRQFNDHRQINARDHFNF